jgi:ankyrin repeat protein
MLIAVDAGELPTQGPDDAEVLAKARIIRAEARYLEWAMEPWAMENGKDNDNVPVFSDLKPYFEKRYFRNLDAVSRSLREGGTDLLGNPYLVCSIEQGVAVHSNTIAALSTVTTDDPAFWGHHDLNVLKLIDAAKRGDVQAAEQIVRNVKDVNQHNNQGDCAMQFALGRGDTALERLLISRGGVVDENSAAPLKVAIDRDDAATMESLLRRFPKMLTAKDWGHKDGPVGYAVVFSRSDEVLRLLLENGADAGKGEGYAVWHAVGYNRLKAVSLLLEHGAAITDEALQRAKEEGHVEVYELLLRTKKQRANREGAGQ